MAATGGRWPPAPRRGDTQKALSLRGAHANIGVFRRALENTNSLRGTTDILTLAEAVVLSQQFKQ